MENVQSQESLNSQETEQSLTPINEQRQQSEEPSLENQRKEKVFSTSHLKYKQLLLQETKRKDAHYQQVIYQTHRNRRQQHLNHLFKRIQQKETNFQLTLQYRQRKIQNFFAPPQSMHPPGYIGRGRPKKRVEVKEGEVEASVMDWDLMPREQLSWSKLRPFLIFGGPERMRIRKPGYELYYQLIRPLSSEEDLEEVLVPIRIEIEVQQGQFFRDTFTWNLNEQIVTPLQFSIILCDDFQLNQNLAPQIAKQIEEQLEDFREFGKFIFQQREMYRQSSFLDQQEISDLFDMKENLEKKLTQQENDRRIFVENLVQLNSKEENGEKIQLLNLPFEQPGELRMPLKLSVLLGHLHYLDHLELDLYALNLNCQYASPISSSPESIAKVICQELGLGGEMWTAISHLIREQAWMILKSLVVVGFRLLEGGWVLDEELVDYFFPVLESNLLPLREQKERDEYTPLLLALNEYEMEKMDKEKEREIRSRKRRSTRGGGRRGASKNLAQDGSDMFGFQLLKRSSLITETTAEDLEKKKFIKASLSSNKESIYLSLNSPGVHQQYQVLSLPNFKDPPRTMRTQVHYNNPCFTGWLHEEHSLQAESLEPQRKKVKLETYKDEDLEWVRKFSGMVWTDEIPVRRKVGRAAAQHAINMMQQQTLKEQYEEYQQE